MIKYSSNSATKSVSVPYPIELDIISDGNGTGVATLQIFTGVNSTIKLRGGAKFYNTVDGNTGETDTKTLTANTRLTTYIKCTSGTSQLTFNTKKLTKIEGYTTPSDAPKLGGDLSDVVTLTWFNPANSNTQFTFSLTKLVALTRFYAHCNYNTGIITGSINALTSVEVLSLVDAIATKIEGSAINVSGNLGLLTSATVFELVNDSGGCNFTGDLNNLTSIGLLYGDVYANCTITVNDQSGLYYFENNAQTTVVSVLGCTALQYFQPNAVMSAAVVNKVLADFWANKDEPKPFYSNQSRIIYLVGLEGTEAPTGQGITDKTNLQAYRSPNNAAENALWTVTTR